MGKIVVYKINDFIISYSHETQKAFGLLQGFLKQIVDKGDVMKNDEFSMVSHWLETVAHQDNTLKIKGRDMLTVLEK